MKKTIFFTIALFVLTTTKINDLLILDLGEYNFPHHKYMLGVYSHLIVFVVGYFASFLFKTEKAKEEFKKSTGGGFQYKPLLGDRKPALNYRD